jgi:uncharacterized protein (TIGR00369 family)
VKPVPGDFWNVLGFRIVHADPDEAVVAMEVPDTLRSPFGQVLGGMVAALFDTALAVALHRRLGEPAARVATLNLNVTYAAFTESRRLECRARVVSLRTRVAIAEGEVHDDAGTLIAKAVGTFAMRRDGAAPVRSP